MDDLEKRFKRTPEGLEIPGFAEAIIADNKKYPKFTDRLKDHSEHFKVHEMIEELKKEGKL